jgi:DNA-binding Lrp family transcriptional regulator
MFYSDVKYKKYISQRRFGVELEIGSLKGHDSKSISKSKLKSIISRISKKDILVTKYQLSQDSQNWHIKDDSTCGPLGRLGPKGAEIASFVAKGIRDLQHIAEVAEEIKRSGFSVNPNCGFHIHAEAKDLTSYNIGVILAYWIKIEKIISLSLPQHRNNNFYCRHILQNKNIDKTTKYGALAMYALLRPRNLNLYENEERRVNLNIVNYVRSEYSDVSKRKTIELRWPEGTLNGKDIKCWVRLFLNFIDTCKNLSMPDNLSDSDLEETLFYLGLNHSYPDSFVILSEGLHETKTWFLERILKFSKKKKIKDEVVIDQAKKILNKMWHPFRKY